MECIHCGDEQKAEVFTALDSTQHMRPEGFCGSISAVDFVNCRWYIVHALRSIGSEKSVGQTFFFFVLVPASETTAGLGKLVPLAHPRNQRPVSAARLLRNIRSINGRRSSDLVTSRDQARQDRNSSMVVFLILSVLYVCLRAVGRRCESRPHLPPPLRGEAA